MLQSPQLHRRALLTMPSLTRKPSMKNKSTYVLSSRYICYIFCVILWLCGYDEPQKMGEEKKITVCRLSCGFGVSGSSRSQRFQTFFIHIVHTTKKAFARKNHSSFILVLCVSHNSSYESEKRETNHLNIMFDSLGLLLNDS